MMVSLTVEEAKPRMLHNGRSTRMICEPWSTLSLPKSQSGATTPLGCDTGTREVRVPDQAFARGPISDALAARLKAENVVLRHQVFILSRKSQTGVRLRNLDRLVLF